MPHPRTLLFGRDADLTLLARALSERRVVVLTGPAGVGKTRLAQALAHTFPRARLVELEGVSCWSDVQIGLVGPDPMVLDGVDRLVEEVAGAVDAWLEQHEGLRVVITSRRELEIPGAFCHPLEPLAAPDALALLLDRVQAHGGRLNEADQAVLPALVHRLEALPGSLELAAPLLRTRSAAGLLAHLERWGDLPPRSAAPGPLAARVASSWACLEQDLRQTLIRLAALPGSVLTEGAARACEREPPEMERHLSALCRASLVRPERASDGAEVRFAPYEDVRTFTRQEGERERGVDAYLDWLLDEAQARPPSPDPASARRQLVAAERQGLQALLARGQQRGCARAARVLWLLEPHLSPADLSAQLALVRGEPERLELLAAIARGRAGDPRAAEDLAQLSPQDPELGWASAWWSAELALRQGDADAALTQARRGLVQLGALPWSHARASLHSHAGHALRLLGQRTEAERHFELGLAELGQDRDAPALTLSLESGLALLRAPCEAIPALRLALSRLPSAWAVRGCGTALELARLLASSSEDPGEARTLALRAHADALVLGQLEVRLGAAHVLALLDREAGRAELALQWLAPLSPDQRVPAWLRAKGLDLRGTLLGELGQWEAALESCEAALELDAGEGAAWLHLAAAQRALGRASAESVARAMQTSRPPPEAVRLAFTTLCGAAGEGPAPPCPSPWRLERALAERWTRALGQTQGPRRLVVAEDAGWFALGGPVVGLDAFPLLRRLLLALLTARREAPGLAIGLGELMRAGWPGERMLYEAGRARAYVALHRLRKLGLGEALLRREGGYLLDPSVELERAPPQVAQAHSQRPASQ